MGGYSEFYDGAKYGLDSNIYGDFQNTNYRTPVSNIAFATDPRTANQLKVTSEKLNVGSKVVEVQMVQPEVADSIPRQHLEELNRLRKLVGADLTLHGPLVEPTGVTRQGWDENQRIQAQRQMWSAVERAHAVKPDGNLVVTFHSSNGLPEPETKSLNEKGEEKTTQIWAVDERTGQFKPVDVKEHYFPGESGDPLKEIERQNEEAWNKTLQALSYHAYMGENYVEKALTPQTVLETGEKKDVNISEVLKYYGSYGSEQTQKEIKDMGEHGKLINDKIQEITHGHLYLRDSYGDLKNLYENAYEAALRNKEKDPKAKEALKRLDAFAARIKPKVEKINDPTQIKDLAEEIINGVNVLRTIEAPRTLRPLKEFAIEKASDTFAGVAFEAYNKFGKTAPIISIENPPAGMGLSRADDLRKVVDASRKKFAEMAVSKGISESEAKKQADKLIGVTWDVGHINMIRKFGYGEKALQKEVERVAEVVKHVHLSDNFGMEHTELPMGMGNVPTKMHLDMIDKYNKQVKKVVETGNWYQHFQTTPFGETASALGSPLYGGTVSGPYWNQVAGRASGAYFAGYGMNPDVHHTIYGAGFSGLPQELGGQVQSGRGRFSGTPAE